VAIRDRVTVKTKDGTTTSMVVRKQGSTIDTTEPKPPKSPFYIFALVNKEGEETGEKIIVPSDEIVYVSYDKEEK
jgi:hypothetical protein